MKKSVIFLFCLSIGLLAFGQNQTNEKESAIPYFTGVKFLNVSDDGSQQTIINKYLCKQVCYPAKSIQCNREGIEVIQFVVTPEGNVSDFKIVNSVCPAIDEEMVRALKTTDGMWQPALKDGKAVATTTEIYRVFKIDDELTAEEIMEIFTTKATDYFKRGNVQLYVKNNTKKALKLYSKGVQYLPYDESLLMARGLCCYELGDKESANTDWERIKKLAQNKKTQTDYQELARDFTEAKGYSAMMEQLEK